MIACGCFALLDATWPAASQRRVGPWLVRDGAGGGQRVSAALPVAPGDAADAARAMTAAGMAPILMMRDPGGPADRIVAADGWVVRDPTDVLAAPILPVAAVAGGIATWPPLAIQRDIWAEEGVDASRVAVMDRVKGPKAALLLRHDDAAAGVAFVAVAGDAAMVHAVVVAGRHRRRGVGASLMRLAGRWAAGHGAVTMAVCVTPANAAARALCDAQGMAGLAAYHYRVPPR